MLGNTTLQNPPKPSLLQSKTCYQNKNNNHQMLHNNPSNYYRSQRKTVTLISAATETESVDGSARTMKSSSSSSKPASSTTLYQLLRVKETASKTEIKAAYRSLAKKYHPDASTSANGRDFIEIRSAYETLSDPVVRARYDLSICAAIATARPYRYSTAGFTRSWETDQCWWKNCMLKL